MGRTTWVDPQNAAPYVDRRVIATTPRKLHTLRGESASAGDLFFMLFDNNVFPANGAQPVECFLVRSGQPFALRFDGRPRAFLTGITWAASSTRGVYTPAGGSPFWVNAELE